MFSPVQNEQSQPSRRTVTFCDFMSSVVDCFGDQVYFLPRHVRRRGQGSILCFFLIKTKRLPTTTTITLSESPRALATRSSRGRGSRSGVSASRGGLEWGW